MALDAYGYARMNASERTEEMARLAGELLDCQSRKKRLLAELRRFENERMDRLRALHAMRPTREPVRRIA